MRTMVRISTPSSSPKSSTRWSRRRAVRACVAPSDSETPSGTSTMPSAVISVGRRLLTPEPMRTRSRAVRGLASGSRMRYGARRRVGISPAASPAARISFQRATRYGLSSSNSRAWASMTRSAWSVVISSVSPMKPAVRAK